MNAAQLKVAALWWLRLEKRCPLVAFEYDANHSSRADVYAVTDKRFSIEIEVKISAGDLRREFDKSKHTYLKPYVGQPSYFYLLVPNNLVELALRLKRPEWGVLTPFDAFYDGRVHVLKSEAKATKVHSNRVPLKDCVRMCTRQTMMIADMSASLESLAAGARSPQPEYAI